MRIGTFAALLVVSSFGFIACGPGDADDEGDEVSLEVEISAPSDTIHTNGRVTIQVVVTEGDPERVILEKDGVALVNLEAPYRYEWDTAHEAEGMYALRARAIAGDVSAESSVRNIVVDRTAPTVVSRLPLPGSSYACGDVPARIGFSEPIQTANVSDAAISLENAEGAIPVTLAWSEERTGFTLTPQRRLRRGEVVTVNIDTTLSDLAGNALIIPEGAWSWESPEYCSTTGERPVNEGLSGGQWFSELITLGADRKPVLVWTQTSHCRTYLSHWQEEDWSPPEQVTARCGPAHLHEWEGELFIALGENPDVFLLRKVDGAWAPMGGAINPGSAFGGFDPVAAFDASGRAMVAWWERTENYSVTEGFPLYLRWWNGTEWQDLGGRVGGVFADSAGPSLDINASGFPIVAYGSPVTSWRRIVVKQWDGLGWSAMGLPIGQGVENPKLVVRHDDVPFVAYEDQNGAGPIMVSSWNGTAWQQLGDGSNLGPSGARDVSMVLDSNGRPVVAFTQKDEASGTTVQVRRWNGSTWVSVGGAFAVRPAAGRHRPSIALDANNLPVVSVTETTAGEDMHLHVWRFNG